MDIVLWQIVAVESLVQCLATFATQVEMVQGKVLAPADLLER